MEFVLSKHEQSGGCLRQSKVLVERGKVVLATPEFSWAVGGGLHAVLSWCARRKVTWKRQPSRKHPGQMELSL